MRVAVVGATGNVGTSVVDTLVGEAEVEEIVAIARRRPERTPARTRWVEADIARDDLAGAFAGVDAVVHLAWAIQPSRDAGRLRAINVDGSERVFRAASDAGARALVYASSVGAYSPAPNDRAVDESWPTEGIASSFYSRHKAEVERLLDRFEREHPDVRVVRMRPALIFKREAAEEIRRLFVGPLMPRFLADPRWIPVLPRIEGLRFQAVHSRDVGEAYRLAVIGTARGAFNLAADPVLDPERLGEVLGARPVPVPSRAVRGAASLAWRLRLTPTPAGWLDMALAVPVMSSARARRELGWSPRHTSTEALLDLLAGIRERAGREEAPPLDPDAGGPLRLREFLTGIGGRNP